MKRVLDVNPGLRSEAEWREILAGLVESLSAFTGVRLAATSWLVEGDWPGHASACNCVNVRGTLHPALRLDVCGAVCVTVNFGEAAWASCDLLLFAGGRRVRGREGADIHFLSYVDTGWTSHGWVADDNGEWESHSTDEWWAVT